MVFCLFLGLVNSVCWMLDTRYWILDTGYWLLVTYKNMTCNQKGVKSLIIQLDTETRVPHAVCFSTQASPLAKKTASLITEKKLMNPPPADCKHRTLNK